MKLGTISMEGDEIVGLSVGEENLFCPLAGLYHAAGLGEAPHSLRALIEGGEAALGTARQAHTYAQKHLGNIAALNASEVSWLPPVTDSRTILGCAMNNGALNSSAHVVPAGPMFFVKPLSSLTGHNKPIEIGQDYGFTFPELELAVVIGKRTKNVSESDALSCIFGYAIMNDVTSQGLKQGDSIAVDLPSGRKNAPGYASYFDWRRVRGEDDNEVYFTYHARSKGADTFGPIGPWVTTADEIPNPDALEVRGYADGELFAEDSTAAYTYSIAKIVAHASRYFTLQPGDIITCGTAAKGTAKFPRAHHEIDMSRLTPVIDIEISGLGCLSNPVQHIKIM